MAISLNIEWHHWLSLSPATTLSDSMTLGLITDGQWAITSTCHFAYFSIRELHFRLCHSSFRKCYSSPFTTTRPCDKQMPQCVSCARRFSYAAMNGSPGWPDTRAPFFDSQYLPPSTPIRRVLRHMAAATMIFAGGSDTLSIFQPLATKMLLFLNFGPIRGHARQHAFKLSFEKYDVRIYDIDADNEHISVLRETRWYAGHLCWSSPRSLIFYLP